MTNNDAIQSLESALGTQHYISEPEITMAIHLASVLEKPLLIEGPAGVGKTEVAKVLAQVHDTELIRLQCYDGIDASQALYEWNYQHQLMFLKMQEARNEHSGDLESTLYSNKFLLQRPILRSILSEKKVVLLIDEVDRSDEEFESFLLEVLSDWQISIPESGTIQAITKPYVVLTSNGTRPLSDALRRRCMYLYIDYPDIDKERSIVASKVPGLDKVIIEQICQFMKLLREKRLRKLPGIAETLDWARALASMHINELDKGLVESSLGLVLKDWRDQREVQLSLSELLEKTGVKSKLDAE